MKKVLITGFDPFGGESINPAYEAVKALPDTIDGAQIIKLEVPTVFGKSIEVLDQAMALHHPDLVICIGQAGGRYEITPERVAINEDDARIPDNEKNQPIDSPIFEDGEPAYFSRLPIKAMVKAMKDAGIPSSVSNTAGTYVCNHLMYGLLYLVDKKYPGTRGGFIHVPFATDQVIAKPGMPSLTLSQMTQGLEAGIKAALEHDVDLKLEGGATH